MPPHSGCRHMAGGRPAYLPRLKTELHIHLIDTVSRSTLTQTFINPRKDELIKICLKPRFERKRQVYCQILYCQAVYCQIIKYQVVQCQSVSPYIATPPDGSPGRMTMLMYTWSLPQRDSTFEAGVVIHEYAHGLSNRLTGGLANSNCLGGEESGGMGEGWSDFFATAVCLKSNDTRETDYLISAWVNDWVPGIRAYPYLTSMTTNPHVYSDIDKMGGEPHSIGEICASVLYEILWNLIYKHGKNDGEFPQLDSNGVPTDGKFLTMKIVLDAMALQPCYPAFNQARKAIIDADKALTGGANYCELWAGFAKRGMGPDATNSTYKPRMDDFNLPVGCLN
ncbi:unnamed protein product [Clonostachys chloroleuca]|uniref:Extracellular metalloproteinase n=1 Tax=Clonostachys chloroleuca TaxID=1926264 RepID=A0AA35LRU9_9HYPO|nr:unnamed protein product [Clonostachys chloroleuca]